MCMQQLTKRPLPNERGPAEDWNFLSSQVIFSLKKRLVSLETVCYEEEHECMDG